MFSWVYYNSYVEPAALGVGAVLAQAMKLDTAQQVGALHGAARPARLATSAPAPGLWPGHALSCSFACLHAFLRAAGGRAGAGGGAPGELGGPEWCMALLPLPDSFCSSRGGACLPLGSVPIAGKGSACAPSCRPIPWRIRPHSSRRLPIPPAAGAVRQPGEYSCGGGRAAGAAGERGAGGGAAWAARMSGALFLPLVGTAVVWGSGGRSWAAGRTGLTTLLRPAEPASRFLPIDCRMTCFVSCPCTACCSS